MCFSQDVYLIVFVLFDLTINTVSSFPEVFSLFSFLEPVL